MTPKERLLNRLQGKPVDKIPNLNIVMLFAAQHAQVPYGDFCKDYNKLVEAQLKTAIDFKIDILSTMSDPYREVADFGAEVVFQEDDLPLCEKALLSDVEDIKKLTHWDPLSSVRMLDRINAIRLFREKCGDEYPILGWVEGPWAEFTDLATVSEGMMMLFDEPEMVSEGMQLLTEQAISCAIAQINAGADIIGVGDAAASLVSPDTYREFIFPLEKKIIDAIHENNGKVKLHICGNINHILPDMIQTGADIIDVDYMVDFENALALANGTCSICGNLNPVELIMQSTPEQIAQQVEQLTRFDDKRFLISSGCEIPKSTSAENVMAIANQLEKTMISCR